MTAIRGRRSSRRARLRDEREQRSEDEDEPAQTSRASSTLPACARRGRGTAAIIPPSGTAICRSPRAKPSPGRPEYPDEARRSRRSGRCPSRGPRRAARRGVPPWRARTRRPSAQRCRARCRPRGAVGIRSGRPRPPQGGARAPSRGGSPSGRRRAPRGSDRTAPGSSGPIAGSPNWAIDTEACAETAPTRSVRGAATYSLCRTALNTAE